MAKVIRKFPWSPNGYDVEMLLPGDERDFRSSTAGLLEAGFVEVSDTEDKQILPVVFPSVDVPAETKPAVRRKRN